MTYKPFDKKLFEQNDPSAREICKDFIEKRYGVRPEDNPNKYGPDLVICAKPRIEDDNQTVTPHLPVMYIEVERKKVWDTKKFPFDTVQFPERKKKFVKEGRASIWFFMLNKDSTRALMVRGDDVVTSPLAEVPNVYVSENERFFQVPLEKVAFFDLEQKKA